jgi:nucleotide-binding universal stress UspA family protein
VLAVPPGARALPRRALVAVDFSAPSLAAARAALALLGKRGALHLVHVGPQPVVPTSDVASWDPTWRSTYDRDVEARLAELARGLGAPEDVHVEHAVKHGDPTRELLAFAERADIDLIATGSRGHGAIARAIVGSVSTRVARAARCAVLVTPPAAVPRT